MESGDVEKLLVLMRAERAIMSNGILSQMRRGTCSFELFARGI